ncbi:hypothetical protein [Phaeobacter gallaeciensis]|nr:hypothetical protein [Phaeobacter gallaeciensis]
MPVESLLSDFLSIRFAVAAKVGFPLILWKNNVLQAQQVWF